MGRRCRLEPERLGLPHILSESKPEPKEEKSPLIAIVSAIVLIIGVGVSLASSSPNISREAFLLLSAGLLLSAIVLFVSLLRQPIAHYWTEKRSAGREDRISHESLDTFQSYVERLRGFATLLDSPIYPLSNLKSQADFTSIPDFNPWLSYVQNLCIQFSRLLGVAGVNRSTFVWAVNSFSLVVNLFNDHVFRAVSE